MILALALMAVFMPAAGYSATCTTTVSSTGAASTAVNSAASGSVVCLADGSYGSLSVSASKTAPGVTVQAQNAGKATITGATVGGSYITVAQFKVQGGSVDVRPGSTGVTVSHNLLVGTRSDYGVYVCPGSTTNDCNDVTITGNRFQGSFNEDQIQANIYHDGPDADPYGLLIEGNEFVGNVEWGNHNDVFQTVWGGDSLYFRKNYLHDFGGQGFFVKDQPTAIDGLVFEDNLIVRQNLPCDPTSLCPNWQLSPFQIFGPLKDVSIRHNTVWPGSGGGTQWLRGSGWAGPTVVSDNVFSNLNSDAGGLTTAYTGSNNANCGGYGFPSIGLISDCSPAFADAANGDYRLANGRGVTWRVDDQQYGPGASSTPVQPPAPDTTPPGTSISSGPANPTSSTSPSFVFTATQSGSTFQCKLDSGAYTPCTSPKAYSALGVGSHTFSVRAIDPAGNTDATPATQTWTIAPDQDPGQPPPPADAPPTAELNAPANGAAAGSTLLLTPTVADDRGIGHVEFWLDDALLDRDDNPPFRTQIDTDRLSDATHTISLRVFDTSGQAVSTAVRLRVVTDDGTSSVRRGADLSSAPVGEGVTRLQGDTTPGSGVLVSLTPCTSQAGTITDRFALLGDDAGSLDMLYAQGDQCVLELQRLQR